jgi:hypothetical protein
MNYPATTQPIKQTKRFSQLQINGNYFEQKEHEGTDNTNLCSQYHVEHDRESHTKTLPLTQSSGTTKNTCSN